MIARTTLYTRLHAEVGLPRPLARALSAPTIPALNAVRAISVALVILYHGDFGLSYVPGAYGVTSFFVLSGFLITWLLLAEHDGKGAISVSAFIRRRSLRILPAFLVYWGVIVAYLLARGRPVPWSHALSALLFVSNYHNALHGDPNNGFSHTWSLATEEQFYLLWPAALLLLLRRPSRGLPVLLATVTAIWAYRIALVAGGVRQSYLYAAFDARCDALLVGCALAFSLRDPRCARWWGAVCHRPLSLWATAVALALVSTGGWWTGWPWYRDAVGHALFPILAAVGIAQAMAFADTPVWRWLEWPAVAYVGRISYSLYLWQQLTLYAVTSRLPSAPKWSQAVAAIGVTLCVAGLSYKFVETPLRRMRLRRVGRPPTLGTPAPSAI